jgi:integrase
MRASQLETRTARLKLPISKKPDWVKIGHGLSLGYRRNHGPGTWSVRVSNGKGGHRVRAIGTADDFDAANGEIVLDFWQAQEKARTVGLGARYDDSDKLVTVEEVVEAYRANLRERGGDTANADRIRAHLPEALATKTVALLTARDFKPWRDALANLTPAAINRANNCFKASLNLAADRDERITNQRAWEKALASIPDATQVRNVILSECDIRAIITAAYEHVSPEFGLLVEVAATTGARVSQIARLTIRDLQADRPDPRVMMPSSRKGRGRKRIDRQPVPIPAALASRLIAARKGRHDDAPLLIKPSGEPWKKSDHLRLFNRAAANATLDSADNITIYALRHSNIVRQLLAGVPIRIVAVNHDTSVMMIERTYSRHIADHGDALSRRALLDFAEVPVGNVVSLPSNR